MDTHDLTELIIKTVKQSLKESKKPLSAVTTGVSARHAHLSRAHVDILFGVGYALNKKKELMGGQFAAFESVTIVGTKMRAIENVRVLGPEREFTQVEVSKTDAIKLGITAPVRNSGDIKGSAALSIVGPCGAVYIEEGCIVAKRHIHMPPDIAKALNLADKSVVDVMFGKERGGLLCGVVVRVDSSFTFEMHIDTDEANALGIVSGDEGYLYAAGDEY